MSTAIARTLPGAIEAALIHGDLSNLDPNGRLDYYKAVCESLGLNPLTRPFEYITLNNKLTLYAKRDCAEQLRKIHGVAITSMVPAQIGDLFVVTVTAADKSGRADSSTGAVNIKGVQGENLANAMMKAETKAKRRVTLSICGLGLLDETEVDSIPDARPFIEETKKPPLPEVKQPTLVHRQLEASVNKLEQELDDYRFHVTGNIVTCRPVQVLNKKTKGGKDYMFLKLDAEVEGQLSGGFCYHASLFDALSKIKEQQSVCQFEWSVRNNFLQIDNVLDIDGTEYRDGKPYNQDAEPESLEINDDDIPF